MSRIKAALIDLSGTLHVEDEAIPLASEALKQLRSLVKVKFVTNTTKESKSVLHARLLKCGFEIEKRELFTSLTAARHYIEHHNLRPHLMLEKEALEDFQGIETRNPNAVVIGLSPTHFDYEHVNEAFRLVLEGAQLISIHKGRYYKQKDGLSIGPGAYATAIEFATGAKSVVVGKPEKNFFKMALNELSESEAVMIGDDVNDDVIGAINAGLKAILVKTGKYREGDESKIPEASRNVAGSFADAVQLVADGRVV